MNIRRILALAGVFLILLLYGASLVLGIKSAGSSAGSPVLYYGGSSHDLRLRRSSEKFRPFRKGQPLKAAGNNRKRLQKGRQAEGMNPLCLAASYHADSSLRPSRLEMSTFSQ